jgi:hypothetical protein
MGQDISGSLQNIFDRIAAEGRIYEAMPVWDNDKRAIVNSIARSAVFSVVEKGTKIRLIEQKVPAPSNYEIMITGEQLNESDKDVYLQAMHYFRGCKPNEEIRISARDFLLSIGRQDGTESRKWLWKSVKTIAKTILEITITLPNNNKIKFVGSLLTIISEEKNGVPDEIRMRLPLDALRLYNADCRTLISMSRRLSLKGSGSQLAKALQAKIYSHKAPFPMKIETIMGQCGSKTKRITDFKKKLIMALELLKVNNDIEGYCISREGIVEIKRKES